MTRIFRALCCAFFLCLSGQAFAQEAVDKLAQVSDPADFAQLLEEISGLDADKALPVLKALAGGTLFVRKADTAVVIGEKDGERYVVTRATTLDIEDMADADDLEAIAIPAGAEEAVRLALAKFGAEPGATVDADSFASLVAKLGSDGFAAKGEAVEKIANSGEARAILVLQALSEGRLFLSNNTVLIGERAGAQVKLQNAATGEAAGEVAVSALQEVTLNNNLRGTLRGAMGRLAIGSDDPALRRAAVLQIMASPSPEAEALLRDALTKETEKGTIALIDQALAIIDLFSPDASRRLQSVRALASSSDPSVRGQIQRVLASESDATVKSEADKAIAAIESRLVFVDLGANLFQGISLGSVLLLAAIGLAVTFGVMGVINMAHGEMIMLGAYTTFVVQEIFRAYLPTSVFGLYLIVSLPAAFLVAGAVGVALERGIIRFLYGRPLETLLATWGISLILQQVVRSIFGAPNKEVANPAWMTGGVEVIGGFILTYNRLCIVIFCFMVLAGLAALLRYSSFGLNMRAVTQNRPMASAMGIRTGQVDALTFGLGSGIAGVAGVALSQIGNVSPNLGQAYIVDSFMVVVFGGVGSLWGTLVGAMSLGIVNKFLEPYAGAMLGKILVLVFIILFIQKRPRGLFALKGRSVEV